MRTATTLFALLIFAGCSGTVTVPPPQLTGRVTLDGQAVGCLIVFVGSDGTESPAVATGPDGSYRVAIPELPGGTLPILLKPLPDSTLKEPPGPLPGLPAPARRVAPPAKYATAAGGLSVTLTGGTQTHDIPLQ